MALAQLRTHDGVRVSDRSGSCLVNTEHLDNFSFGAAAARPWRTALFKRTSAAALRLWVSAFICAQLHSGRSSSEAILCLEVS